MGEAGGCGGVKMETTILEQQLKKKENNKLAKLNQDEINNLNSHIIIK